MSAELLQHQARIQQSRPAPRLRAVETTVSERLVEEPVVQRPPLDLAGMVRDVTRLGEVVARMQASEPDVRAAAHPDDIRERGVARGWGGKV